MGNIQKKHEKQLRAILKRLNDAQEYLLREEVVGIAEREDSIIGNTYIIKNEGAVSRGKSPAVRIMEHRVGSPVHQLYNATRDLGLFLEDYTKPVKEKLNV